MDLDAGRRRDVVERVLRAIEQRYVDPAAADQIAAAVRDRLAAGAYDGIDTGRALAAQLTADLRDTGGGGLLEVSFRAAPDADDAPRRHPGADRAADANFGFERAERLAGNVGRLVVRAFHPAENGEAAAAATAAMTFVAHTRALIFDLRENAGGAPSMVVLPASFLFGEPVHLNTIAGRPGAPGRENWTFADVPGPRYPAPVYVLTSPRSFGAAEGFAYHLQARARWSSASAPAVTAASAGRSRSTRPSPLDHDGPVGQPGDGALVGGHRRGARPRGAGRPGAARGARRRPPGPSAGLDSRPQSARPASVRR